MGPPTCLLPGMGGAAPSLANCPSQFASLLGACPMKKPAVPSSLACLVRRRGRRLQACALPGQGCGAGGLPLLFTSPELVSHPLGGVTGEGRALALATLLLTSHTETMVRQTPSHSPVAETKQLEQNRESHCGVV